MYARNTSEDQLITDRYIASSFFSKNAEWTYFLDSGLGGGAHDLKCYVKPVQEYCSQNGIVCTSDSMADTSGSCAFLVFAHDSYSADVLALVMKDVIKNIIAGQQNKPFSEIAAEKIVVDREKKAEEAAASQSWCTIS